MMYDFEKGQPFSGEHFYNPYENMDSSWLKANMHAHSKSFNGFANGENTTEEMHGRYQGLGYDIDILTNYNQLEHRSSSDRLNFPSYEHGFNIGMVHQLVINAEKVKPFDFPLFQLRSHKQHNINRLKQKNNLIVLAHPKWKNGHSMSDLQYLYNYDLIEGISERANSIRNWDAALSSGHWVWVVGNDDAHDFSDRHSGVVWTMINGNGGSGEDVLQNLRNGNHYATKGWVGQKMYELSALQVLGNKLQLKLNVPVDSIILKSDQGKIVKTTTNSDTISYVIQSENTYVRAEIFETESWNDYTKTYLNPIVRSADGKMVSRQLYLGPTICWVKSILYWIILLLIDIFLLRLIIKR